MNKNNIFRGYTLIELLAVIVVLGLILAVTIPSVIDKVDEMKLDSYNQVVSNIENTARLYISRNRSEIPNIDVIDGETYITLNDLVDHGMIDSNITDPKTGESIPLSTKVLIKVIGKKKYYVFFEYRNDTMKTNFVAPTITLNGSNYVTITLGDTYTDLGATATDDVDGDLTSNIIKVGTVNPLAIGTYDITYTVTDSSGNMSDAVVRTVHVKDRVGPVAVFSSNGSGTWTNNGSTSVTISDTVSKLNKDSFKYQWTTSTTTPTEDSFSTNFTNGQTINAPSNVTGNYYLWTLAKDTANNTMIMSSAVFKLDNIKPVITMLGSSPVSINAGSTYTDAGATASDNIDGNITGNISVTSTVNSNIAGSYTVTYNVNDTAGNAATPVVRTVNVIDNILPVIGFGTNGNSAYAKSRNTTVTVTDNVGVDTSSLKYQWTTSTTAPLEASFSTTFTNGGTINSPGGVSGGYYLWILAKDTSGNTQITRSNVFNLDNTAPVITMLGSTPVSINVGSSYTDAGATALDNIDGNITGNINATSTVVPTIIGSYTVTYNVSDAAGNAATPVVRTVNVIDTVLPVVGFGTNGNGTYAKSRSTTVTVTDNVAVNTSSLKYQWTTSTTAPLEASFSTTFTNGGTISSPGGVTGGYYLWVLAKDTSGNTQITRSNVFNIDNTAPIITMLGSTPVSISQGSTYTDAGATATDTMEGNITGSINAVSTVNTTIVGSYTVTYTVSDTAGNAATPVVRTVNVIMAVNAPVLASGMTPIKWNGSAWVDTTAGDSAWYDYGAGAKQWANARTADGSMWVWIPRYIYKISTGWHTATTGTINIQFSNGTDDNWNSAVIGAIDTGTTSSASNNKWTNHPGFTFGGTELTGIWIAKFEISVSNTSDACYTSESVANCDKTTLTPKIVPNVKSWRSITIGNMFTVARNMETNNTYGWGTSGTGIDTHMMKNIEWGAATYLSKSTYGQNTNEIWINPADNFTTGCAGDSVSSTSTTGCLRTYDTANGQQASTTGNIYGIYDMSGGSFEYTAAYVNNGNANLTTYGNSIAIANAKYRDLYPITTDSDTNNYTNAINLKGDAVYETSNSYTGATSWFSDYTTMATNFSLWFRRGGAYYRGINAGMFTFERNTGAADSMYGFRSVLLVGAGL